MSGNYELKINAVDPIDDVKGEVVDDIEETPDDILIKLGGCGRYQALLAFVIQLMKAVACFSMSGNAFFAYVPRWRCVDTDVPNNVTDGAAWTDDNMSSDSIWTQECAPNGHKCSKFEYDSSISTLVSEFDLICDKSWVTATIISVQMAGMSFGSVIVGPLSDQYGRRNPFMIGILLIFVGQAVAYFSVHWTMYAVTKFITGIGCAFFLSIYCTLQSEYTLSKWRAGVIGFPSWALEASLFALVAYLLQDWKHVTLVIALASFAFLFFWVFIPESFRWYVSKDRYKEAEKTVRNVAKWNKHPMPNFERMRKTLSAQVAGETQTHFPVFVLFRTKSLLKITFPLTTVWLSLGLVSYGVNFGIQKLSGNIYLNLFLFTITTVPAKILSILVANRYGRRASTALAFTLTGLGGLVVGIVQNTDTPAKDSITNVSAMIANFGINWAWGPIQTMTLEVYPTVIRNTGFGVLSFLARVGAVIGPQLVYLSEYASGLLYFVVAAFALLSIICTLCLPETKDTELLDKMADDLNAQRKKEHTV